MLLDTRISPKNNKVYALSGILYCNKYGASLIRKNKRTKQKPNNFYICSNAKNKKGCSGVSIKIEILENIIFEAIKNQLYTIVNIENLLNIIENLTYTSNQIKKLIKSFLIKIKN